MLTLEDNLIKSSFSGHHILVSVSSMLSFPFLTVGFCQKQSPAHIHSLGCLPNYHLTPSSWSYVQSTLSFSICLLVMSELPLPNPTLLSYLPVYEKGRSGLILSRPTHKESTLSHFMVLLNTSSSPTLAMAQGDLSMNHLLSSFPNVYWHTYLVLQGVLYFWKICKCFAQAKH